MIVMATIATVVAIIHNHSGPSAGTAPHSTEKEVTPIMLRCSNMRVLSYIHQYSVNGTAFDSCLVAGSRHLQ